MRFRYSLRTLLIAVTFVCIVFGWILPPTLRARAFISAMADEDYARAEKLFSNPQNVFPGSFKDNEMFHPRVILKPFTWSNLIHRERDLVVGVSYCDGKGMVSCSVEIKATADGLEQGMALP